jgi:phosphatidylserine decarboxylase
MASMNHEEIKKVLRDVKPHKQGYSIIKETLIWLLIVNGFLYFFQINSVLFQIIALLSVIAFLFVVYAFRNPERTIIPDEDAVFAPVDGKIKSIKILDEHFYFNDKRLKITFYTSPWEVHVKRAPVAGQVVDARFEDKNLAETILATANGIKIMITHRVGYFRKFLFSFAELDRKFEQGDELGLLGSELDIYLPAQVELKAKVGDRVRANDTIVARFH